MRTIDADTLMDILADRLIKVSERYGVDSAVAGAVSGAMGLVDAKSTIKPERKTGRWIGTTEDWRQQIVWWKCSECGMDVSTQYKYCPDCGADMRGEQNGSDK